jgi:putative salt-induced outer membrane protein YdiY
MKIKYGKIIALTTLLLAHSATADEVITTDGARLVGNIKLIDKGTIHLETSYAGTLKISQEQVASFSTEQPRVVRLESGTIMSGPVESSGNGKLKITSEDGVLETNTAQVAATWVPGAEDPQVLRNRREWRYDASLDLTGRSGNVDKFRLGTSLNAELKGPNDTLAFFFEYEQAEEEGFKTEDRAGGGASYESFFSKILGWYGRTELETDRIDNIKFRSTTAGGLSYRLINKDRQSLIARSGVGYRYTAFTNNAADESSPTVDFGLAHRYEFENLFVMKNDLTYVPAIDDYTNYRVVHDSGFEIPIGSGENWKLRMGVTNEYESESTTDEKLDTRYYTRMIYSWR